MDRQYACYCGLYCESCAIKTKVHPAAAALRDEILDARLDGVMKSLPNGAEFWDFLEGLVRDWKCTSCRDGSGNPYCKVRICARDKGVEMCAFCDEFPCELLEDFDEGYPVLAKDNAVLCEQGWEAWSKMQDERLADGFVYEK